MQVRRSLHINTDHRSMMLANADTEKRFNQVETEAMTPDITAIRGLNEELPLH